MGEVGATEGTGYPAGSVDAGPLPSRARLELEVVCGVEVSGYLVGSTAFKAAGTGDPRPAGSIPVHLRQAMPGHGAFLRARLVPWSRNGHGCPRDRCCSRSFLMVFSARSYPR